MYRLWKILLSNMLRPETFGMALVHKDFIKKSNILSKKDGSTDIQIPQLKSALL